MIENGAIECVPHSGDIRTREKLGDCQLHVEWAAPSRVEGESQGRGNSGVFLMGLVEIQVLDNYHNPTYADGFAASVYGQTPPLANALLPPGQFQTYDIVFRRPIFKDGKELDPGYVTVFENGVLVQDHARLEGPTGHMARSKPGPFPEAGPLKLQDHGNPVRFRNIWYRPLPPRVIEGGTDGYLSAEATQAKRQQIAAMIREDAEKLANPTNPVPQMLRLAESLVYDADGDAMQKADQMAHEYLANVEQLHGAQLRGQERRNQIPARRLQLPDSFQRYPGRRRAQDPHRSDHQGSEVGREEKVSVERGREVAKRMECGGKRSATPLWLGQPPGCVDVPGRPKAASAPALTPDRACL